jgi:transcriptional regulator with XRE-family HTH domain
VCAAVTDFVRFERAVGENVARLRRDAGKTQSQLSEELGLVGIDWRRSTVAQVETGRRTLSLAEALGVAYSLEVPLAELVRASAPLRVGVGTWHHNFIGALVEGTADDLPMGQTYTSPLATKAASLIPLVFRVVGDMSREYMDRWSPKTGGEFRKALEAVTPLEEAAARRLEARLRLGVRATDIVAGATRLWNRSLAEERDQRTRSRVGSGASARTVQAVRGLVMRQLEKELADVIEESADRAAAKAIARQVGR